MGAYLNRRDLADTLVSTVQQLRHAQAQTGEPAFSVRSAHSPRQWQVGDRLSEADAGRLVAALTAGTSKRKLAERCGISESSVKRLIRQHGASKPSSGLAIVHPYVAEADDRWAAGSAPGHPGQPFRSRSRRVAWSLAGAQARLLTLTAI